MRRLSVFNGRFAKFLFIIRERYYFVSLRIDSADLLIIQDSKWRERVKNNDMQCKSKPGR